MTLSDSEVEDLEVRLEIHTPRGQSCGDVFDVKRGTRNLYGNHLLSGGEDLLLVDDGVHYPCFRDLPDLKALGSGASNPSHDL